VLSGDGGDNTLMGGLGNDTLAGGGGHDTVVYWDASGAVNVNLATGRASGASGNDQLSGIADVVGSAYDDVLVGDANANRLNGSDGQDTLSGGGGADTFILDGGRQAGVDLVADLGNGDVLQFNAGALAIVIQSGNDPSGLLQGQVMLGTPGNGVTRIYVGADNVPGADVMVDLTGNFVAADFTTEFAPYGAVLYDATLKLPRTVTGTPGDDVLHGGNGDDTLVGGAGGDQLNGSLGNDVLLGGDGYDYLIGGPGNDTLDGGADSDTVSYGNATGPVAVNLATGLASGADGNDKLAGLENVDGSDFNDLLTGDDGDNTLQGGLGNDTLVGGAGEDSAVYWGAGGPVNVNLGSGRATGAQGNDQLASIEDIYGSAYDDVLVGDGGDNQISGSDGNDQLSGGAGSDVLYGGAGNDVLQGGDGDDTLQGDEGNDTLDGGAGYDTVTFNGPESNYVITALGPQAWRVEDKVGGDGVDLLSGVENLSFVIVGTLDGSTLQGGSGYDIASYQGASSAVTVDLAAGSATGAKGSNTLSSIEGAIGSANFGDTLLGNAGDNQLSGLGGDDRLEGGDGNDRLDGGLGADVLMGGAGADVYIVDNPGDQVVETANPVPGGSGQNQGLGVGGSVDRVIACINYTLTNFVENLDLAAAAGNLSGKGNALNNVLNGNEANNTLTGFGGNDTLDGRDGLDTAVYGGARAGYQLLHTTAGLSVGAIATDEGTDSLSNIERLQFTDQALALDLDAGQAAGKAVLMMAATLGAAFTANRGWAGTFLRYFDSGASLLDGATLLVDAGIVSAFAGGGDNASFVKFVYGNVYGQAPDAATLAALVAPLDSHGSTQAQWMADLAQSVAAQQHVGLSGLAQTGWAYDTM
jgi:Ca2+-binding RTX toxin-like protein